MNSDSDHENSNQSMKWTNDIYIPSSSKKSVRLNFDGTRASVGSKFQKVENARFAQPTHENVCSIYQRETQKSQKEPLRGSGIIVQTSLQSKTKITVLYKQYYIIGLVLSCAHLDLELDRPVYMTIENSLPDKDCFKLIPIFKQDYTTRVDTFKDPQTQASVSANDVNLFLLVVDYKSPYDTRESLKGVKPKLKFMKKEDIQPGLDLYLGAYSNPPKPPKEQQKKEGKEEEKKTAALPQDIGLQLFLVSPALNKKYLEKKKRLLENPDDEEAKQIVDSFQKTVKWSDIFIKEKAYYGGEILKKNDQIAAATYSAFEGASGGPVLHFNNKEVFIVGVNHGSAAVGDYSIQKLNELCQAKLMIPSDLKFNFSFIEEHIKSYVAEINQFFKKEKKIKYPANDPSAAIPTFVPMQQTVSQLAKDFKSLLDFFAGQEGNFKRDLVYRRFNLIYGATTDGTANHCIFLFGGERFDKIREICQKFDDTISELPQLVNLKELQLSFGESKEYISEKAFKGASKVPKLQFSTQFSVFLPYQAQDMNPKMKFVKCIPKNKVKKSLYCKLEIDLKNLQKMFQENLQEMYKCAVVKKLHDVLFSQENKRGGFQKNCIEQQLIEAISRILKQGLKSKSSHIVQEPHSQKEEIKEERKEEIKEEKKEQLTQEEHLDILKAEFGDFTNKNKEKLGGLFITAATSIRGSAFLQPLEIYEDNKEVIELMVRLADIDLKALELEDDETKIYVLREVKRILSMTEEEEEPKLGNSKYDYLKTKRMTRQSLKLKHRKKPAKATNEKRNIAMEKKTEKKARTK